MGIISEEMFRQATINDLERLKFVLDASGNVAVRYLQGVSSRGNPVETFADLPGTGILPGEARIVRGDPIMGSTMAIWNGSQWNEIMAKDFNRVGIDASDTADYLGVKITAGSGITLTVEELVPGYKTLKIASSGTTDCGAVKTCIENFSDLDLSGVALTLGQLQGNISFAPSPADPTNIDWTNTINTGTQDFGSLYIANYDGSVINITNNATMNISNSNYISNNNTYSYAGDTIQYIDSTTVTYDNTTNVTYEGDIYIGGDIIVMNNNNNIGGAVAQTGAGVAYSNLSNVLLCDLAYATATPIDPTNKDSILLMVAGTPSGTDLAQGNTGGNPAIYGSASTLWGLSLTPAIVNASNFGCTFAFGDSKYIEVTDFGFTIPGTDTILGVRVDVVFNSTSDTVNVDCITMTVFHTAGAPIQSAIKPSDLDATNTPTDGYVAVKGTAVDQFTRQAMTGGSVDNTPYGPSWSGVTTIAPSKDAIYNEIQTIVGATGVVPGFNKPTTTQSYKAGTTITAGQHCCKASYTGVQLSDFADVVKTINVPNNSSTDYNFGQCINREITGNLTTVNVKVNTTLNYNGANMGWVSKMELFAMTGSYGTTGYYTGAALYTSNTDTQSITRSNQGVKNITYTFNQAITPGYYAVKITGTASLDNTYGTTSGTVLILGDNTSPAYAGNFIDNTTPTPNVNLYMLANSDAVVAKLASAAAIGTAIYIGQATESKTIDQAIILTNQGELDQTGATNNGAIRYLSDTPGALSLTAGTLKMAIAQGSGVDKVWMGRDQYMAPISIPVAGEVQYTAIDGKIEGYCSGNVSDVVEIKIQTSPDNTTWTTVARQIGGGSTSTSGGIQTIQYEIPAGNFYKVTMASSGTLITPTAVFRPIK